MEFLSMSFFSEINCRFSISHKVNLEIRNALNEQIKSELKPPPKDERFEYINLVVTTSSNTHAVEVKGPELDRKEKVITWNLWLPYERITSSTTQEAPYIQFYFDALVILLERYGIAEERLRAIQEKIEQKVIGNSEYKYVDNRIKYDLSDFDF